MATLCKTDGSQEDIQPANGTDFTLGEMQKAVSGYVEVVRIGQGKVMLVNDDGLGLGLPLNAVGTRLYQEMSIRNGHGPCNTPIVGDVVVCWSEEVR